MPRSRIDSFLESTPFVGFMSLITIWALFSDNIRLSGVDFTQDSGFDGFISFVFFLFVAEILLASYAKEGYAPRPDFAAIASKGTLKAWREIGIGSFYFWLDIIATLSLMFEVGLKHILCFFSIHHLFMYISLNLRK